MLSGNHQFCNETGTKSQEWACLVMSPSSSSGCLRGLFWSAHLALGVQEKQSEEAMGPSCERWPGLQPPPRPCLLGSSALHALQLSPGPSLRYPRIISHTCYFLLWLKRIIQMGYFTHQYHAATLSFTILSGPEDWGWPGFLPSQMHHSCTVLTSQSWCRYLWILVSRHEADQGERQCGVECSWVNDHLAPPFRWGRLLPVDQECFGYRKQKTNRVF